MNRYLLPLLATLLLGGCTCNAIMCSPDIGGDPVTSGRIADDLWEVERSRAYEAEATPDTTQVPDSLDVISPARVMRTRQSHGAHERSGGES